MPKEVGFPRVSFAHVSQDREKVSGSIMLEDGTEVGRARPFCFDRCPIQRTFGTVMCTGIGGDGTASIQVVRSALPRAARTVGDGMCGITYENIKR